MKKAFKALCIAGVAMLAALVVFVAASCVVYTPEYVYRCVVNRESKTTDYLFFPERPIAKSAAPFHYAYKPDGAMDALDVRYTAKGQLLSMRLDALAQGTGTTSLIAIHKDEVVYEKYFNGSGADSVQTSFSAVKSLVSLMIGMAIDEGLIQSEDQPISVFLPELDGTEFAGITIRELLMMRSKIAYREGGLWFGDDAKTYYYPDLRKLALTNLRADASYAGQFHYNNYHPLLLGILLERSTGMSVSEYFRTRIWDGIGAEHDASWSLDSVQSGFEKMESGLNFRSIDLAKVGSMLLHRGAWNGRTIVSEAWLDRSLIAAQPMDASGIGYQYMWYSMQTEKGGYDFFAHGKYGQYLYVSPENETVIVRTGTAEGINTWILPLYQMAAHTGGGAGQTS